MKTFSYLWQYIAEFFSEWEMFQTKDVEKTKTHIFWSIIFSPENRDVCEVMCENMVHSDSPRMTMYYGARTLNAG